MRPLSFFIVPLFILSLYSCSQEFGSSRVTYTKAKAVYLPASEFRINAFNAPVRELENPGKIYVGQDYLLVGERNEGIHVLDNSDPENPQKVNFIQIPGNYDYFVDGDDLYANNYFDLVKLDISDPLNVQMIRRHSSGLVKDQNIKYHPENPELQLVGFNFERVTEEVDHNTSIWNYIGNGYNTIYFNYRDEVIPPSSIPTTFVGSSSGQAGTTNRMAIHDNQLYVLLRNRIEFFDAELQDAGSQDIWIGGLETLYAFEDYLYVGSQTSMMVYEITGSRLSYRGQFTHARACDPVLPVSSETAYVTTRAGGTCPGDENRLYVVSTNVSQSQYSELQRFNLREPFGMALVDNKLFVAESEHGMSIFDATDPDRLNPIGTFSELPVEDVLPHPVQEDILLIYTGHRIAQLKVDDEINGYRLLSNIAL